MARAVDYLDTPPFQMGDRVTCEIGGTATIRGSHDGLIPWPVGRPDERGQRRAISVYGGLAEAIRVESEQAVAHWFGVGLFTVWKWRQALGVGATTPGDEPAAFRRLSYTRGE
ncbi:MAG TPA: hypothetical protein VHW93_01435 [Acidimicrobiales bacterium]|nr:hypothetical protein [Acidimicrobiales bacterium]